jgi:hypothetical protein
VLVVSLFNCDSLQITKECAHGISSGSSVYIYIYTCNQCLKCVSVAVVANDLGICCEGAAYSEGVYKHQGRFIPIVCYIFIKTMLRTIIWRNDILKLTVKRAVRINVVRCLCVEYVRKKHHR